jgi:hypothetical protein
MKMTFGAVRHMIHEAVSSSSTAKIMFYDESTTSWIELNVQPSVSAVLAATGAQDVLEYSPDELQAALDSGSTVWTYIDPYASEMSQSGQLDLAFALSREKAEESYNDSAGDI